MRAKEFISEDRQKLDEVLPFAFVPVALKGLALAGLGYQAYESWNDYQDYKSGKIDGAELSARIGVDAATALIGGAVGKGEVGLIEHKGRGGDLQAGLTRWVGVLIGQSGVDGNEIHGGGGESLPVGQ